MPDIKRRNITNVKLDEVVPIINYHADGIVIVQCIGCDFYYCESILVAIRSGNKNVATKYLRPYTQTQRKKIREMLANKGITNKVRDFFYEANNFMSELQKNKQSSVWNTKQCESESVT